MTAEKLCQLFLFEILIRHKENKGDAPICKYTKRNDIGVSHGIDVIIFIFDYLLFTK